MALSQDDKSAFVLPFHPPDQRHDQARFRHAGRLPRRPLGHTAVIHPELKVIIQVADAIQKPGSNRTGEENERSFTQMTKSMRALLMGAALSGFVAGTTIHATAQDTDKDKKDASSDSGKKATKEKKDKHACKGLNSCKGKGGCGATKGKNDCKGKGECRTDGKPMEEHK